MKKTKIIFESLLIVSMILSISIVAIAAYPSYTETDCRNCHGNVVDRHHKLLIGGTYQCTSCHTMRYEGGTFYPEVIRNCLVCHPTQNHVDCIACHSPKDVNISLFGKHANMNTSDGYGNVSNNDCWTCHYQKNMNRSNVYLCDSCHINSNGVVPVTNSSLIIGQFYHGMTTCKGCHASTTYHVNGTAGPLGILDSILKKMKN